MRYVCSICGYVYDDAKEKIPFSQLPDSWKCPVCGAPKAVFVPEEKKEGSKKPEPAKASGIGRPSPEQWDGDMKKLPASVLSAICSNLARGCEKQYKNEESALFKELADYFAARAEIPDGADADKLEAALKNDLESGYPSVRQAAEDAHDRGTQRVCVWGEKVTKVLRSLVERYRRDGSEFLKNTKIWVCSVCGFVYVGEEPPALCPVCKVPSWKFDMI